jgi:glutathione S-transferase
MYTLYWNPGSASMTAHGALEEAGAKYDLKFVDMDNKEHQGAAYLKLNPLGKVPALVVDGGQVLTESAAIALHIADRHPDAKLAPALGDLARGHCYQWLLVIAASLQSAMLRYYYPDRITADAAGTKGVSDKAMEEVAALWGNIDAHLGANGPYLLGKQFSVADIFAYVLSTWQQSCPDTYERFPNVKRLADLVAARPAMKRVIEQNKA